MCITCIQQITEHSCICNPKPNWKEAGSYQVPRRESRVDVVRRRWSGLRARRWLGTGLEEVLLDFQVVLIRLPGDGRAELDVACSSTRIEPNWPQGSNSINVESDWRWQRRLKRELMWTSEQRRYEMKFNKIDFVEWIAPGSRQAPLHL